MTVTPLPDGWFNVLKHRSVADKIAVPMNCAIADTRSLPVLAEMVRGGVIVWIDRRLAWANVTFRDRPNDPQHIEFPMDIYQLTLMGIKLCNEHGIEQA